MCVHIKCPHQALVWPGWNMLEASSALLRATGADPAPHALGLGLAQLAAAPASSGRSRRRRRGRTRALADAGHAARPEALPIGAGCAVLIDGVPSVVRHGYALVAAVVAAATALLAAAVSSPRRRRGCPVHRILGDATPPGVLQFVAVRLVDALVTHAAELQAAARARGALEAGRVRRLLRRVGSTLALPVHQGSRLTSLAAGLQQKQAGRGAAGHRRLAGGRRGHDRGEAAQA
mmetsp:Transcript_16992/g.43822  ORF Transcript_16992/g.43822 Transcript_16992/m.43822 type:complete len:234 (+) Transcript_16992:328-1029(+)